MNVVINGQERDMTDGSTVADVLRTLGRDPGGRGIAVALNGEVLPRSGWERDRVAEGDRIEVLSATQGG